MTLTTDCPPRRTPLPGCRPTALVLIGAALLGALGPGVSAEAASGVSSLATSGVSGAAPGASATTPSSSTALIGRWTWPTMPPHVVERGYDAPAERWSPGHRGIDVAAPAGSLVTAPESGAVRFTGVVVDRPVVSIEHADGVVSSFEPVVGTVERGTVVARGEPIGVLQPGHCGDAACLHLGARVDGRYVNPLLLLGELRPAVLLPTRAIP